MPVLNPLVSVVIPMYNSEHSIIRCIESVRQQTYSNLEVFVVNDGSTDSSLELLKHYLKEHSNFNCNIINKPNGGVSSARNAGLKCVNGDYVAFLDSDDEWHLNKLEIQLDYFYNNTSIDFMGGNSTNDYIHKYLFRRFTEINEIEVKDLILKNYFQPSTVLFKRNILNAIGFFDEKQNHSEDTQYFIRIAHQFKCVLVNHRLINYGTGSHGFLASGLSGNLYEMEKGELKNIRFAYKEGYIGLLQLVLAVGFSIFKYIIRIIRIKLKK